MLKSVEGGTIQNAETTSELIDPQFCPTSIIGESEEIVKVQSRARRIASTNASVLILGETGTGKELFANSVHYWSQRRLRKFVRVNCAALQDTLLESELFGHEKGSFTGAHVRKVGKFEVANKGTIFLDEIGDMSPSVQAKVLRVLEEQVFERVGGIEPIKVDVRVISATNADLYNRVKTGSFRRDLFHRLNTVDLHIPRLHDRNGDVELLSHHFLGIFRSELKKDISGFTKNSMKSLRKHSWPGNIRELRNIIEKAAIFCENDRALIDTETLELDRPLPTLHMDNLEEALDLIFEKVPRGAHILETVQAQMIMRALVRCNGVQKNAADVLGISRRVLCYHVMKNPALKYYANTTDKNGPNGWSGPPGDDLPPNDRLPGEEYPEEEKVEEVVEVKVEEEKPKPPDLDEMVKDFFGDWVEGSTPKQDSEPVVEPIIPDKEAVEPIKVRRWGPTFRAIVNVLKDREDFVGFNELTGKVLPILFPGVDYKKAIGRVSHSLRFAVKKGYLILGEDKKSFKIAKGLVIKE